jgi:hypothetical protein
MEQSQEVESCSYRYEHGHLFEICVECHHTEHISDLVNSCMTIRNDGKCPNGYK